MTAALIDFNTFQTMRTRRATGQPLYEKRSKVVPIEAVQRGAVIDIAGMPPRPGIIGLKVKLPDGRIGKVAGVFEVNRVSFARVWLSFLGGTTAVDCRELEFLSDGPGSAA